jgi:hypothetical protein
MEPVDRRRALQIGGLAASLVAVAAACGEDREGDTAPGRVGFAPPITDPPSFNVNDVVLLRTASSLEHTIVNAYRQMLALQSAEPEVTDFIERVIDDHLAVAEEMGELAESLGGEAWNCTNDWYMDRGVVPIMSAIVDSDNRERDIFNAVVVLENLGAATHQSNSIRLEDDAAAEASLRAATLESRHSAGLIATVRGPIGYVSPGIDGNDESIDEDGVPRKYAITSRFGSTGQNELIIGAPDENGVRQTLIVQTPAENSFVYEELEPTC